MRLKKCEVKHLVIIILFLTLFFLWNTIQNNSIQLIHYELSAGFSERVRIVQLTDLHNHVFGDNNYRLVKQILNQKPDIVVMTGDMINEGDKDLESIISLIGQLSEINLVYYSMGNDETVYEREYDNDLVFQLENAGAIVLNYEYQDIIVKGNKIRIGGYYGYYRTPHMDTNDKDKRIMMNEFCDSFEDTENFKMLLCHIPTSWLDWSGVDKYPIDLVLCGHYHGGQIRIPFLGGLYAPYIGWFPEYTKGYFTGKTAKCILSAGLGSEGFPPRINNPPEIVIIDLK